MLAIKNNAFYLQLSEHGPVGKLQINDDPERMNWVIDAEYVGEVGYPDEDKAFGHFSVTVNRVHYASHTVKPVIGRSGPNTLELVYEFDCFVIFVTYDLDSDGDALRWKLIFYNTSGNELTVDDFFVWSAFAYIMYRDPDVERNISQSCAVFPSVSKHFSKLACVRRSHKGPHLGVYSVKGETKSVGTYCRFENLFFKNVSPSLDGMLYHNLVLIGTGTGAEKEESPDWIYMRDAKAVLMPAGACMHWEYAMMPYADEKQYYEHAYRFGHPVVDYDPATPVGGLFHANIRLSDNSRPVNVWLESFGDGRLQRTDLTDRLLRTERGYALEARMDEPGEKKLTFTLGNRKTDSVVFNVMEPARSIIEARAAYICEHLYQGPEAEAPHAFLPLSNQGESLGKLNFVLQKNRIGSRDPEQIRKAECSAVHYMKPKWFLNGDFYRPAPLYGPFYRIIDFDYIAHAFYLLSTFAESELTIMGPRDYLEWAAEVMIVRLDERLHDAEREKKETQMLGVYILFIRELLQDLQAAGLTEPYERLSRLWADTGERLRSESGAYKGAVTEHFYDNAGFGPTCEALCLSGHTEEARRYGELLLANIGYGNDFRVQNPDRWWEALSFMIHSLWGGMVAASTLAAYEHLRDSAYLVSAYRATVPVFYCYDWHATATAKRLGIGEAASTYSVAGPNLNRPDLSRNRFGQSAFASDGGLFAELFSGASGDDWDMGEELAAYLAGFGTKCFLYEQDGEIRCVNGEIARNGDEYVITSYAAYPREYYFYEQNASFVAGEGEEARTVIYRNGKFSHDE